MARLSAAHGSQLPTTPQARSGLVSLLQSFGARSSATSVTKQMRTSAQSTPTGGAPGSVSESANNSDLQKQLPPRTPSDLTASPPASGSEPPSLAPFPTPQKPQRPQLPRNNTTTSTTTEPHSTSSSLKPPTPKLRRLRSSEPGPQQSTVFHPDTETTETASPLPTSFGAPSPKISPQPSEQPTPKPTSPPASPAIAESSADELARSPAKKVTVSKEPLSKGPEPKKHTRKSLPQPAIPEGVEMEYRSNNRRSEPRRSGRSRTNHILESDTLADELSMTPPKRQPPRRIKKDTMRQRLRDDIEAHTKVKATNFLVAHRDRFLPLLPKYNYINRLEAYDPPVPYKEITEQPRGVKAVMKPYQLSGLSFLVYLYNNGIAGILGDEMGLGKTLQTLSLFQYLEEQDEANGVQSEESRPYLVVVPLSVLNSWVAEARRWVPNLKVLQIHGTVKEREHLKRVAMGLEDQFGNETNQARDRRASRKAGISVPKLPTEKSDESFKIIVTTFECFQTEQTWFKHSFVWRYIVLDEGHKIKSHVTAVSKALRSVSAEYRLILTGTPLQNNMMEMWSLLSWLYPQVFTENTSELFKSSFNLSLGEVNLKTMDDARNLLELIMLRRMKDSPGVDLNLPPKEEVLLYVPLTPMQRFWYTRLLTRVGDAILDDLFTDVKAKEKVALLQDVEEEQKLRSDTSTGPETGGWEETADIMRQTLQTEKTDTGSRASWMKLMNLVMQLRKCCSHPYLIPGAEPDPYYLGDHVIRASGKFIMLEKLLKNSIFTQGKKCIIFSGFTQTLDCVSELLTLLSDYGREFKHLRLDGNSARARRNLDIRLFNTHEDYKVILVATRAGGLGITLTAAEDVFFLDEDWNPQITLQAEARAHRIGQQKKVTIYKLCTQGTVEEQMMGRIRKKLYLSAKITESMRNIHSEGAVGKGKASETEDMPQMDTTQLKSLVRRGAQTLSHPAIDVNEMLSWDHETAIQKCRDKPSDPTLNPETSAAEIDEEKWLSTMERVQCAVFDGKRYQREKEKASTTANILPDSIKREDRRKGKNVTVMVGKYAVNKESMNCAEWEAIPTMAGKDDRLKDVKRERRQVLKHEIHCLACFDDGKHGKLHGCKGCPRAYHKDCLESEFQAKVDANFGGFHCPQHECVDCLKKTTNAGGLIYRCRWCENGFCEDCLEWDKTELIGDNLPEFEMMGEGPVDGAFYIKCPSCKETMEEDEARREWILAMEKSYAQQHGKWLQNRDKEVRKLALEREREEEAKMAQAKAEVASNIARKNTMASKQNAKLPIRGKEEINLITPEGSSDEEMEMDAPSPPSLTDTDTSAPTPADTGVSTPNCTIPTTMRTGTAIPTKRTLIHDDILDETPEQKRIRLDEQVPWDMEDEALTGR